MVHRADVGTVEAATKAGAETAGTVGGLVSVHVIRDRTTSWGTASPRPPRRWLIPRPPRPPGRVSRRAGSAPAEGAAAPPLCPSRGAPPCIHDPQPGGRAGRDQPSSRRQTARLPADPRPGRSSPRTWHAMRARGYPPTEGDHALIVEVAPAPRHQADHRPRAQGRPRGQAGVHFVEAPVRVARGPLGRSRGCDARGPRDPRRHRGDGGGRLRPRVLCTDVIVDVTDRHAVIINRDREASMLLPARRCWWSRWSRRCSPRSPPTRPSAVVWGLTLVAV